MAGIAFFFFFFVHSLLVRDPPMHIDHDEACMGEMRMASEEERGPRRNWCSFSMSSRHAALYIVLLVEVKNFTVKQTMCQ